MSDKPYISLDKLPEFGIHWNKAVLTQMVIAKDFPASVAPNTWRRADIEAFCRKRDFDLKQPLGFLKRGEHWYE
jgi:hypothetical protein